MFPILFLSPYVLIPLLMAFIWQRVKLKDLQWTYVFTIILIFLYPFIIIKVKEWLNPPVTDIKCGTYLVAIVFGNFFIFLPITLVLQYIFNRKLNPRGKKPSE